MRKHRWTAAAAVVLAMAAPALAVLDGEAGLEGIGLRADNLDDASLRYRAEGRPDPFVPPPDRTVVRPGCAEDLPRLDQLRLVGILDGPGTGPAALFVGGAAETSYLMRVGMAFCDGSVHEVDAGRGLVVVRFERPDRVPPVEFLDIRLHPEGGAAR